MQELHLIKAANEGNILSLSDSNVRQLSPRFHNFEHLQGRNIKFHVFVGGHKSELLKHQSKEFAEVSLENQQSVKFKVLDGIDHFKIAEKLSEAEYEITRLIINNS